MTITRSTFPVRAFRVDTGTDTRIHPTDADCHKAPWRITVDPCGDWPRGAQFSKMEIHANAANFEIGTEFESLSGNYKLVVKADKDGRNVVRQIQPTRIKTVPAVRLCACGCGLQLPKQATAARMFFDHYHADRFAKLRKLRAKEARNG